VAEDTDDDDDRNNVVLRALNPVAVHLGELRADIVFAAAMA
jgi:hypothetical protein